MAENKLALFKKVARDRVALSDALLTRMNVSQEAYERFALNALLMQPDIAAKCTLDSFEDCIIQCIEHGLIPDGDSAAIIPFGSTATLVPMVKGRRTLAQNASPGIHIRREVVYKDDYFKHAEGANPVLEHEPNAESVKRLDDVIAAYAATKIPKTGEVVWRVTYRPELDRARAKGKSSGWKNDTAAMYEKTAEHRLLKLLPTRIGAPVDLPASIDPESFNGLDLPAALPAKAVDVTDDPPPPEPEKPKPAARTRRPKPTEKPAQRQREQPVDPGPEPTDDDAGGSPF